MRTTVNDIARATGLSAGTVSRALDTTGKYRVSKLTRQKVEAAAREFQYRPNLIGRALSGGSTRLISLMCESPFSTYYIQVSQWMSSYAARDGYTLVMDCAHDPQVMPDLRPGAAKFPRQDWIFGSDGIVICDEADWQRDYVLAALDMRVPVVELGLHRRYPVDAVIIDLRKGTMDLMNHLVAQGCRDIVFLTDHGCLGGVRAEVYREALAAHGLRERVRTVSSHRKEDGRKGAVAEILDRGMPDAFFCANDALAIGCSRGIADLGFSVPKDVALAGCDGLDDTEYLVCPITTIAQPVAEMCKQAWTFLRERVEGQDRSARCARFEGELVVRESTLGFSPAVR